MEKSVFRAEIVPLKRRSKMTYVARIPTWVYPMLDIDLLDPVPLLFVANENEDEVHIRKSTVKERIVGIHLELYLDGLWDEPADDEVAVQLELEELHKNNPSRFINYDGRLLLVEPPFNKLTSKELHTFLRLGDDESFTYATLRELDMSIPSATKFVRTCLELGLVKEIGREHTGNRGRPVRQFTKTSIGGKIVAQVDSGVLTIPSDEGGEDEG